MTDVTEAVRHCRRCDEDKPLTAFQRQGNYYRAVCRDCVRARGAENQQRKAKGLPALARETVRGKEPLPNGFEGRPATASEPLAPGVLLVDRARGQVILCTVMSEISMGAARMESVIDFYANRGHRIVDAIERPVAEVMSVIRKG